MLSSIMTFGLLSLTRPAPRILGSDPMKWMRECEIKHGRVAMLALPTLVAIQQVTGEDPLPWLNAQSVDAQLVTYATAAGLEGALSLPRLGPRPFTLREGETPGKLFRWTPTPSAGLVSLEDAVGRGAMLLAAAALASGLQA